MGIFVCEILNGSIPFLDKPPTLIMLEKLKGSQPLVMDRSTLDESLDGPFKVYLKRKIPRHFHDLVNKLTHRDETRRPTAKMLLKVEFNSRCRKNIQLCIIQEPYLRAESCQSLVEKLKVKCKCQFR